MMKESGIETLRKWVNWAAVGNFNNDLRDLFVLSGACYKDGNNFVAIPTCRNYIDEWISRFLLFRGKIHSPKKEFVMKVVCVVSRQCFSGHRI